MYIATCLHTYFFGKYVGNDEYGNKYFRSAKKKGKKEKRWVLYKGIVEPSKIPADWHMWLHYTNENLPNVGQHDTFQWQKPHAPNFSMTEAAYDPCKTRKRAYQPYQKWNPSNI